MFTKNSSCQAKQWILHTVVTFYGHCMKMCEHFTPNYDGERTGCCLTTAHRLTLHFFLPGNFWPRTTRLSPPTPALIFFITPIEDKIEKSPFWYNWGDQGRITGGVEHPLRTRFPGCVLKMAGALEMVHTWVRELIRGWPWRVFDQIEALVMEIMDGSLLCNQFLDQ
jgi:hypothetical protein